MTATVANRRAMILDALAIEACTQSEADAYLAALAGLDDAPAPAPRRERQATVVRRDADDTWSPPAGTWTRISFLDVEAGAPVYTDDGAGPGTLVAVWGDTDPTAVRVARWRPSTATRTTLAELHAEWPADTSDVRVSSDGGARPLPVSLAARAATGTSSAAADARAAILRGRRATGA